MGILMMPEIKATPPFFETHQPSGNLTSSFHFILTYISSPISRSHIVELRCLIDCPLLAMLGNVAVE